MTGVDEPVVGDAFGDALRACWTAGASPGAVYEIVERDDGFINGGNDMARYFAGPDAWSRLDRMAVDAAARPVPSSAAGPFPSASAARPVPLSSAAGAGPSSGAAGGRVLDIGCGGGRHLAALRDRGIAARGVDTSPGAVAVCRERGLDVDLGDVRRDLGDVRRLAAPTTRCCSWATLGSPADAPAVLDALAAVAAPGARLLAGGSDPAVGASPPHHAAYHARNVARGRRPGQLTIRVRFRATATPWFDYWFMPTDELAALVAPSPWRLDDIATDGPAYLATLTRR